MDFADPDILSHYPVSRYRLTVAQYRRMGEAGILAKDNRVELLEGQLVAMSPIRPRHALAVDALMMLLITACARRASVRVQHPVTLDDGSEPQPDVAVVRRPWQGFPNTHPGVGDIFLLVEASGSSQLTDSGAKRAIYARAGVVEYWIVNLRTDTVQVHRAPVGGTYTAITTVKPPTSLDIEALPGVTIPAADIFT